MKEIIPYGTPEYAEAMTKEAVSRERIAGDRIDGITQRIQEAVAAEREACAVVCDQINEGYRQQAKGMTVNIGASQCAAAIRARK
jgi:hypothetical protein